MRFFRYVLVSLALTGCVAASTDKPVTAEAVDEQTGKLTAECEQEGFREKKALSDCFHRKNIADITKLLAKSRSK